MVSRKSIIKSLLFVCLTLPLSIFSQSDTLELPFFEDWNSGSFTANSWIADSGWAVNPNEGNPFPAAFFDARNYTVQYNKYLTSALIDATNIAEGEIWLKFDVKLNSQNPENYGKLYFKIEYDGGSTHLLHSYTNINGSFDWQSYEIDISQYSKGKHFKLIIQSIGDPNAVNGWYVDNIEIARICEPPKNLEVAIDTLEEDTYRLNFTWEMDEPELGEWIHWDDGYNYGGIGFACTGKFCAAARWDSGQLEDYDNFKIKKIKAFLSDGGYDSLHFNICTGENGSNHLYSSDYLDPEADVWIEHIVDTTIYLNADLEYWVGYGARIYTGGVFPLGYDFGPAVPGYGDMLKSCDSETWDKLSDFGFDYNWNIQFYVEEPSGKEFQIGNQRESREERIDHLVGYKFYESIDGGNYHFLEYIPWTPGDTTHSIEFINDYKSHCYQLIAVYASPGDLCESSPAISKDNPEEDFVCVLLVGDEESRIEQSGLLRCFPNPFSNTTTIEYTLQQPATVQISIFNHLGEQIDFIQQKQSPGKQQVIWDAKGLPSGMYYFTVQVANEISRGKMMIVR